MLYIHQTSCISAQQTFNEIDIENLSPASGKKMNALEPAYPQIPPSLLRRMGKAVRMGIGAAMPVLQQYEKPGAIIMASANAGKEDCVKFLDQVIEYNEGLLTPLNFVQSTPNAVAGQLGLLTSNNCYNITHLHTGLAFEFALTDADMLITENPGANVLVGAVDDISIYNYHFEQKKGWFKNEPVPGEDLYATNTPGTIPGEAAAMFMLNGIPGGAVAKLIAVDTIHNEDENMMLKKLSSFLSDHLSPGKKIDLLLTGENGDNRLLPYYNLVESTIGNEVTVARFKHMSGEFPTAAAFGLWLGCEILKGREMPRHMIKKNGSNKETRTILLYNNYKKLQHSFMLLSAP